MLLAPQRSTWQYKLPSLNPVQMPARLVQAILPFYRYLSK